MKRIIIFALIFTAAMVLTPISSVEKADADADDFIEIRTVEDLYNVRNDLTANYKLMNDIDLSEATSTGGQYDDRGYGWRPIGYDGDWNASPFTGEFDGNGHTITGYSIKLMKKPTPSISGNYRFYMSLFAKNSGTINNLHVRDYKIYDRITINPKGTSVSKLVAKKKSFVVKWKKQAKQINGYQIQYSTKKTFKSGNKSLKVNKATIVSKTITKLKAKKKYFVRIRTYKKVSGKTYYSSWSKVEAVKTK